MQRLNFMLDASVVEECRLEVASGIHLFVAVRRSFDMREPAAARGSEACTLGGYFVAAAACRRVPVVVEGVAG